VLQQLDDPTRFVLVEVYRTPQDPARHKETAHYQIWRDRVADMMAEPRSSVKYTNAYPDEEGWG
jgi:quinol monooxygenase YgiN